MATLRAELKEAFETIAERQRGAHAPCLGDASQLRSCAGKRASNQLKAQNVASRVPARYLSADLLHLEGPSAVYGDAVDALVSLHPLPFSRGPQRPGGIVAIVGPRGTGKTHMSCALVNLFNMLATVTAGHYGKPGVPLYRRALDLFTEIKSTFGRRDEKSHARTVQEWADASLLVIDEVQVRSESAWENDIITNLIDRRYAEMRPTVLVSNLEVGPFLESVGDSVASRLLEVGSIIRADWPSFRKPQA